MKMKMLLVVLISLCFSLLTGCSSDEAEIKKAVRERLKDPDSAKFGKLTQINENLACITVNSRNSMGGYSGDQQAAVIRAGVIEGLEGDNWLALTIVNGSQDRCLKTLKTVMKDYH